MMSSPRRVTSLPRHASWTPALGPTLLISGLVFLFTPAAVYRGNPGEFQAPLRSILGACALPAVALVVVLLLTTRMLPERARPFFVALLFTLALGFWIQGSFLVGDYGTLDGTNIDWSSFAWTANLDLVLWAALIGAATIFARRSRPKHTGSAAGSSPCSWQRSSPA